MDKHLHWLLLPAIIAPATIISPVYATQYLTIEAAQKLMFPQAAGFESQPQRLTETQREEVEAASDVKLRTPEQPVWRVMAGDRPLGWFVVDEVYGKHEFITYAVALDTNGAVVSIEVLDYRETHGGEIRNPEWRAQFTGKRSGDALKLDEDIQNISGATLSCKHISEGVRRVLAIHEVALK